MKRKKLESTYNSPLVRYGLDSECTKLIMEGYDNKEILEFLNRHREQKKVSLGDIDRWRKEVIKENEKNGRRR